MSHEHSDREATPADTSSQTLAIPWWAVITAALLLLLPVLIMSSMMLVMGLIGPPMHGWMAASGPGLFRFVGVVPVLLVITVVYGLYRVSAANIQ